MLDAQAKAPGKLYIAGEYAVVESGYPAVIVAVDRFITVSLSPSDKEYGTIRSSQLSNQVLNWTRINQQIVLDEPNEKAAILIQSLIIAERFLNEQGYILPYYDLTVESALDSLDGRKYGLGSSGAVTVATIQALLKSVTHTLSDEGIFKLAVLVHMHLQSRGSFGDLAAATYTGWVAYSSVDKEWLSLQLTRFTLTELVNCTWPSLKIERLPSPKALSLLVGWTGIPASTEKSVTSLQKDTQQLPYHDFLHHSKRCVQNLINGLKTNNTEQILEAIRYNRIILLEMSQTQGSIIETPLLHILCLIAFKHGASAKSSGAGGGDCGIAFVHSEWQKKRIISEWQDSNIEPLPLNVYDKSNS